MSTKIADEEEALKGKDANLLGWSGRQVRFQSSKHYKKMVIASLMLFAFIDVLGTCLFMPLGPVLCQQGEGGPIDTYAELLLAPPGTIDFDKYGMKDDFKNLYGQLWPPTGVQPGLTTTIPQARALAIANLGNPKAFKSVPTKFSTSVQILVVSGGISGGFGAAFWGWISDRVGRKICMIICHGGGLLGYLVMYFSGQYWNSFWGYACGQILNGLFSGAFTIVNAYFSTWLSKEEAEGPNGALMGMSILGGGVGALVLMPFIEGRGENCFLASWIGIIGTIVSCILVTAIVVEPRKTSKDLEKNRSSRALQEQTPPVMPKMVVRILWITLIAGGLDAAGDEGTRIARGTIMQNVWPATNDIKFQNLIVLSTILLLFFVWALIGVFRSMIGLGPTCVVGSTFTLITQLMLNAKIIKWEGYVPYLIVWYGGKLFGMMSSFAGLFIVSEYAPDEAKGEWSGKMQGISGVLEAVATLSIALLYDANNTGSEDGRRGVVALFLTAAISFITVIAYLPLIKLVPKRVEAKQLEKKFRSLEDYEALSDVEYRQLTLEEIDFHETRRMKDGKMPRMTSWGNYAEEVPYLEGILKRSSADFQTIRTSMTDVLSDPVKMAQERKSLAMFDEMMKSEESGRLDEERVLMGEWMGKYFDDAGYLGWHAFPQMFKAMLMNAFPPIDKLDGITPEIANLDIEDYYIKFMTVSDQHLAAQRSRYGSLARLPFMSLFRSVLGGK